MPDSLTLKKRCRKIVQKLGSRSIVMVGMMGAGKSSLGRRLAVQLDIPFHDADQEIEKAANMSVEEIFSYYGEEEFRRGEQDVILRLLHDHAPQVLATGGGAYMNEEIRMAISQSGVGVWLRADFDVLMNRVRKKTNRPLLKNTDPEAVMRQLMDVRYPFYRHAPIIVDSEEISHDMMVRKIVDYLYDYLMAEKNDTQSQDN